MIKSLRAGETIRHRPQYEPWLVIRVFEYGWFVVDLLSAEDPSIPRLVLPRNYFNWIRDRDVPEKEVLKKTEKPFEARLEKEWNIYQNFENF